MIQSTLAIKSTVPFLEEGVKINQATKEIHRAVQWIAQVAEAFVATCENDSHTTMAWNKKEEFFYGQTFSEYPLRLGFCPGDFSWLLMDDKLNNLSKLSGSGISDETVWGWLQKHLLERGISTDSLSYDLAYSLPYDIKMATKYSVNNKAALEKFSKLRTAGILIIKAALLFSRPNRLYDKVCTWPYDLDTCSAINVFLNGHKHSDTKIKVGLAIANDMINEHYLYVSYWNKKAVFNSSELPNLPSGGYWLCKDGWCGAVLPVSNLYNGDSLELDKGVLFMIAAIETLFEFVK
ncbi:hypothetical protein [Fodinibius sp.]|uniref:hypothetical protein n=1 Tax=Fodinibius sp. TaxID=1872440 RepID=UPI002ACD2D45|nr:hypothetical protein [Fodinibius sp.]MDZ7659025.1 hypothetical protein [Fodinibius sp.]